jgi:hypothetical protein
VIADGQLDPYDLCDNCRRGIIGDFVVAKTDATATPSPLAGVRPS